MKYILASVVVFCVSLGPLCGMELAHHGAAGAVIIVDPAATATEVYAAQQLAANLKEITGANFVVRTDTHAPSRAIVVGQGAAAQALFHDAPFGKLDGEEWVIRTKGNRLLLAGGRPRGTLYAVSRFLQEQCGVRWWTPWASRIPSQPKLRVVRLNERAKPAFEYRAPFWFDAFDGNWSWENLANSQSQRLTVEQGGKIDYALFVHTFYPLVPPDKNFVQHP